MPHISLKDNPSVFTIDVKQKGVVGVDVVELEGRMASDGVKDNDSTSPEFVAGLTEAVRAVIFSPNGAMPSGLTDAELFAVGGTCLNAYSTLGKEPGGSPTSLPATA